MTLVNQILLLDSTEFSGSSESEAMYFGSAYINFSAWFDQILAFPLGLVEQTEVDLSICDCQPFAFSMTAIGLYPM